MTLRQAQGERPNAVRGEAMLHTPDAAYMLRPTFAALCAAEEELGPLFALVERAATGELKLAETSCCCAPDHNNCISRWSNGRQSSTHMPDCAA